MMQALMHHAVSAWAPGAAVVLANAGALSLVPRSLLPAAPSALAASSTPSAHAKSIPIGPLPLGLRAWASAAGQDAVAPRSNAFALFTRAVYHEVAGKLGTRSVRSIAPRISEMWAALSEDERESYRQTARDLNKPRNEQAAQAKALKAAAGEKKITGYHVFVKEELPKVISQLALTIAPAKERGAEAMRQVATAWKALSEQEKEVYKATASDIRKRHQQ